MHCSRRYVLSDDAVSDINVVRVAAHLWRHVDSTSIVISRDTYCYKSRQARKADLLFTCLISARYMRWQPVSGRQSRNALSPSYEPGQFQSILPSSWMETDGLQQSKACRPSQATSKAISRCRWLSFPCIPPSWLCICQARPMLRFAAFGRSAMVPRLGC